MAQGKIYRGERTIDAALVTVDDRFLDERRDLKLFTDHGFEWSYEGDGPRQLALAILADHLGDDQAALQYVEAFMVGIVANFDNDWEMTSAHVESALENVRTAA